MLHQQISIFHKTSSQVAPASIGNLDKQHENQLHLSRHLLDDSVIEDKPSSDATSTGSSEGVIGLDGEIGAVGNGYGGLDLIACRQNALGFQGCVRRKTILKDGRKPAVASWQRYWVQIWANSLVYFPPKSFKGYYFYFHFQMGAITYCTNFVFFFLNILLELNAVILNVNHVKYVH